MAFKVVQKFLERFNEQGDPPKMPHIGLDVSGIHALLFQVNIEDPGEYLQDFVINAFAD